MTSIFTGIRRLIGECDGTEEAAVVVHAVVDVCQEILNGDWSTLRIQFQFDFSLLGLDQHAGLFGRSLVPPAEARQLGWQTTGQMLSLGFGSIGWFVIPPRPVAKHFAAQFGQRRVVFLQFIPCVDVVMECVILAIVVKPVLGSFGPVLVAVLTGVGPFPQPLLSCGLEMPLSIACRMWGRATAGRCRARRGRTRG